MSVAEVVDDLLELEDLGRHVGDRERRRLDEVRLHMAKRERGAKVSDAAAVLGVSQPTIRTWIDEGVLPPIPEAKPIRVDVLALADLKRAVDLVRAHAKDEQRLVQTMRVLRDRAALEGAAPGLDDYRTGRVVPMGDLEAEIADRREQETRRRSTS